MTILVKMIVKDVESVEVNQPIDDAYGILALAEEFFRGRQLPNNFVIIQMHLQPYNDEYGSGIDLHIDFKRINGYNCTILLSFLSTETFSRSAALGRFPEIIDLLESLPRSFNNLTVPFTRGFNSEN